MKCQNCHTENNYTDKYCKTCGKELLHFQSMENNRNQSIKIFAIILVFFILSIAVPLFSIGIDIFQISSEFSNEVEKIKETTGTLDSYVNCDYEYQVNKCNGLYKYNVNGKEYKIRGTKKDQMEYLEKEITVYYNPEMPSDSSTTLTIYTDTADMFTTVFSIVSIVIFIVVISLILLIVRIFKKINQENSRIDNNDHNNNKPIKL